MLFSFKKEWEIFQTWVEKNITNISSYNYEIDTKNLKEFEKFYEKLKHDIDGKIKRIISSLIYAFVYEI